MFENVSVALSRRAVCGEGPLWHGASDTVYWVDIEAGEILRTDLGTGTTKVIVYPEMVGAVAPRERGGMVAAVTSSFVGLTDDSTVTHRVDCLPEGIRMNDAKTDPAGRYCAADARRAPGPGPRRRRRRPDPL